MVMDLYNGDDTGYQWKFCRVFALSLWYRSDQIKKNGAAYPYFWLTTSLTKTAMEKRK